MATAIGKVRVKIKDAVIWPRRWLTPHGTRSEIAPVYTGLLLGIRVRTETLDIALVVDCVDGKYYGILRLPNREAYQPVLDFLRRNTGRRLRDVIEAEIDFPQWFTDETA